MWLDGPNQKSHLCAFAMTVAMSAMLLSSQNSWASSANSNSNHFCKIVIVNSGTLGASIEGKMLSSKLLNGRPGLAQITSTNSSFRISIDTPYGFTSSPAGANTDLTMKSSYLGYGSTSFSETPGTTDVKMRKGSTDMEIHLTAERLGSTPFRPGTYSAELTLRCE